MSSSKKILFISVSAGMGHVRAAEALRETAQKKYPTIIARHIDMVDYSSALLKFSSSSSYTWLARYSPALYGVFYHLTNNEFFADFFTKLSSLIELNSKKMLAFVDDFKPDYIICTHFLAPMSLKKYSGKVPIGLVVTDYKAHKMWRSAFVDNFFVASKDVKEEFGNTTGIVEATGLPVCPDFFQEKSRLELKKKLGINNDWPTALLMAGGFGLIKIDEVAKKIMEKICNLNLVTITGKAKNSIYHNGLDKIQKNERVNLVKLEFVKNIDEWMRVADLIITKPGGMTVTECMTLKKPMLLINPIPGQEKGNVKYIEKNNFGREVKKINEIADLIKIILEKSDYFNKPNLTINPNEEILKSILGE